MDETSGFALEWLLASQDPAVRFLARRDICGEEGLDPSMPLASQKVERLFEGQQPDGGFGVHPYRKWIGAHWRLVSLVELGVGPGVTPAVRAADTVLDWLTGDKHRSAVRVIDGLARRCASQEGNALAVCSRLGMASDPRVELLAESLVEWQWPDGGWNCDVNAAGHRSSFHETLPPMWGLFECWRAGGGEWARDAALRSAELFLSHRLFRSLTAGEVIRREWLAFHYPPYWHYDILQALLVLSRMDLAGDERCTDALEVLGRRRLPDGRWRPGAYWWRGPKSTSGSVDVVDWGRSGPNEMITLNALRVLART